MGAAAVGMTIIGAKPLSSLSECCLQSVAEDSAWTGHARNCSDKVRLLLKQRATLDRSKVWHILKRYS